MTTGLEDEILTFIDDLKDQAQNEHSDIRYRYRENRRQERASLTIQNDIKSKAVIVTAEEARYSGPTDLKIMYKKFGPAGTPDEMEEHTADNLPDRNSLYARITSWLEHGEI